MMTPQKAIDLKAERLKAKLNIEIHGMVIDRFRRCLIADPTVDQHLLLDTLLAQFNMDIDDWNLIHGLYARAEYGRIFNSRWF